MTRHESVVLVTQLTEQSQRPTSPVYMDWSLKGALHPRIPGPKIGASWPPGAIEESETAVVAPVTGLWEAGDSGGTNCRTWDSGASDGLDS